MEEKVIKLNDRIEELKSCGLLTDHMDEIKLNCSNEQKKVALSALQKLANNNRELFNNIKFRFKKQYNCSDETMEYIEKICLSKSELDIGQIKKLQDDIANILFEYFDGMLSRKSFYPTAKRKLLMLSIRDNYEILSHMNLLYKQKYNVSMII